MSRPPGCRRVSLDLRCTYFKPRGVPLSDLDELTVGLDELEALRLADLEGLYQEKAAAKMRVSRATFARIVESARRKVAEALIQGKALRLEGGNIVPASSGKRRCTLCRYAARLGQPPMCSTCKLRAKRRSKAGSS
jgi:predicted DNA-binding protein (UPF0251 family)